MRTAAHPTKGPATMLVAGIDSSTSMCKVVVYDAATGERVREGRAPHPPETIVDPEVWWDALLAAVVAAGGIEDVAAVSVSGQQHTPILLDETGAVVRDSPLWNDTGSHAQMMDLNRELGRDEWIRRTGLPLTLSDTAVKLRWVRDVDPDAAERTAAVAIVHDWLTWRLKGHGPGTDGLDDLTTDRSEVGATGYWSPDTGEYCTDLVEHAFGHQVVLPTVLGPRDRAGVTGDGIPGVPAGIPLGVGAGDNGAAALALGITHGDTVMSLGTSGVVYSQTSAPIHDYSGYVCNYGDATGENQPLVATLNAARNFALGAGVLGCTVEELSDLALQAEPGAGGLTLLPYFVGERTPDLPHATGSIHQATLTNFTRPNFARAIIEGTIASQVAMLDYLAACGIRTERLLLIGGGAQSPAVQRVLREMVDVPVVIPASEQYVAKGAAMQAVAALTGEFPKWTSAMLVLDRVAPSPVVVEQHEAAKLQMGYFDPVAHAVPEPVRHDERELSGPSA